MNNLETNTKEKNLVEFEGLSKDEKKAIAAYNNVVNKGLALLKGEPLKASTKIPSTEIEVLMEEMLEDQLKEKRIAFKEGFKEVLKDKALLDSFITEKQKEFNKAVVAKKREFTKKADAVLNIINGIEELKNSYLETLTQE